MILKTARDRVIVKDYTMTWQDAWIAYPHWHPDGAYGYELEIPNVTVKDTAIHLWLLSNDFETFGWRPRNAWITYETRKSGVNLEPLLTNARAFVLKYWVDHEFVYIIKRNGILWVEEIELVPGQFVVEPKSMKEAFI